jgi:hypothetical protein
MGTLNAEQSERFRSDSDADTGFETALLGWDFSGGVLA